MRWYYIVPAALVAAPVFLALFVLVGGGIVMLLWNWLLPPLFDWPTITLLQGFGLLALCRILFGGFGGRGHRHSPRMTPEERERFRQRMGERFCRPSSEARES
jgi:hypothetical protein